MNVLIPNLPQICAQLLSLLSKENEWKWMENHDRAFEEFKKAIQAVTEIKHFKRTNR